MHCLNVVFQFVYMHHIIIRNCSDSHVLPEILYVDLVPVNCKV